MRGLKLGGSIEPDGGRATAKREGMAENKSGVIHDKYIIHYPRHHGGRVIAKREREVKSDGTKVANRQQV